MADFLVFENVSKSFGTTRAADNVSLSIRKGEFFSLLGPSGRGKTTLLRILAGFEQPDAGRVLLDGEDITSLPPNKRKVNTIFQNYALFPHLTVWENIAFGLRIAKRPRSEVTAEVQRMLRLIQMEDQAHKRPDMISGGQKQRVAIARALINDPVMIIADEPTGNLDSHTGELILQIFVRLQAEGRTVILVTHDPEIAAMTPRRLEIRDGKIANTVDRKLAGLDRSLPAAAGVPASN